ncbi:zinc finger protein 555-like isoform X2 [Folsomia candida]|uniref:zinc finger protein 555-like isoform X2 n=1 Tax=Folsomia candida TaxID=158441 RepID=UPI0016050AAA|nr:zinc finger protein 555-like isoform X2 [Folsomia candida]
MRQSVGKIPTPLECPVCQKHFPTKSCLNKHVAIHDDNRGIKCEICGKVVKHLRIHKSNVHKNRIRPAYRPRLPCGYLGCDKTYLTKAKLKNHVGQVHSKNPVRFLCKLCGKELNSEQSLEQHIATHTTEKSLTCPVCGKGFIHLSNLKQHQLTHRDRSARKEFLCKMCPRTFLSRLGLIYHIRTFHENQKHSCDQCPKNFVTSSTLRRHRAEVHPTNFEGGISYACDKCEYQSHLKYRLNIHRIRQHVRKGHMCYFCGKEYFTYIHFTKHVARHNLEV